MTIYSKIILALATLVLLIFGAFDHFFHRWREQRDAELKSKSLMLETSLGMVEFAERRPPSIPNSAKTEELANLPTLIVLHGGGGGFDQGLVVGGWLAEHGFRVISISRPGYLQTPLESGLFLEEQADLVAAFSEKLLLPKSSILAVAEASPIALLLSIRYPKKFDKIVLLSPLGVRRGFSERGKFIRPGEALLEFFTGDMGCWLHWLRLRWFPDKLLYDFYLLQSDLPAYSCLKEAQAIFSSGVQFEWFSEWFLSCLPQSLREAGIRNDVIQLRGMPEIDFASVKNPVLIIRGENDSLTPTEDFETLSKALPAVVSKTIPQTGFLLPMVGQNSADIQNTILNFLGKARTEDMHLEKSQTNPNIYISSECLIPQTSLNSVVSPP